MVVSNGKMATVLVIVGLMGGIWSMTHTTPFNPYQRLIDAATAAVPSRPLVSDCKALGPLPEPIAQALHCPKVSSAR